MRRRLGPPVEISIHASESTKQDTIKKVTAQNDPEETFDIDYVAILDSLESFMKEAPEPGTVPHPTDESILMQEDETDNRQGENAVDKTPQRRGPQDAGPMTEPLINQLRLLRKHERKMIFRLRANVKMTLCTDLMHSMCLLRPSLIQRPFP